VPYSAIRSGAHHDVGIRGCWRVSFGRNDFSELLARAEDLCAQSELWLMEVSLLDQRHNRSGRRLPVPCSVPALRVARRWVWDVVRRADQEEGGGGGCDGGGGMGSGRLEENSAG